MIGFVISHFCREYLPLEDHELVILGYVCVLAEAAAIGMALTPPLLTGILATLLFKRRPVIRPSSTSRWAWCRCAAKADRMTTILWGIFPELDGEERILAAERFTASLEVTMDKRKSHRKFAVTLRQQILAGLGSGLLDAPQKALETGVDRIIIKALRKREKP